MKNELLLNQLNSTLHPQRFPLLLLPYTQSILYLLEHPKRTCLAYLHYPNRILIHLVVNKPPPIDRIQFSHPSFGSHHFSPPPSQLISHRYIPLSQLAQQTSYYIIIPYTIGSIDWGSGYITKSIEGCRGRVEGDGCLQKVFRRHVAYSSARSRRPRRRYVSHLLLLFTIRSTVHPFYWVRDKRSVVQQRTGIHVAPNHISTTNQINTPPVSNPLDKTWPA